MTKDKALRLALEALEGVHQDPKGWWNCHVEITAIKDALAQPQEANNFCPRCGKRTPDPAAIHTCTPPRGLELI